MVVWCTGPQCMGLGSQNLGLKFPPEASSAKARINEYTDTTIKDVSDLFQRWGREARAGGVGWAYFFAPYWHFDRLGKADEPKQLQ